MGAPGLDFETWESTNFNWKFGISTLSGAPQPCRVFVFAARARGQAKANRNRGPVVLCIMAQRDFYIDRLRSGLLVLARTPAFPPPLQHSAHPLLHHQPGLFHGLFLPAGRLLHAGVVGSKR